MILLVLITVYPIANALYLSTHKWILGGGEPAFVGMKNFVRLFTREMNFYGALRNTIVYAVGSVSVSMLLGLGIALLFSGDFIGKKVVRALILFPMMKIIP